MSTIPNYTGNSILVQIARMLYLVQRIVQHTGNSILVQIARMGARAGQPGLPTAPAGHLVRMPHYIRLLEVQIQMQIQIQIQIQIQVHKKVQIQLKLILPANL